MAAGNYRAYMMLIVTTWCWGCNAIFSKIAVDDVSPMMLVTLRWLGVITLLVLFARRPVVRDWPILKHHMIYVTLMGIAGFTAFNALFYQAGHTTSAVNIGIIQGSIPVFVILGGFLLFRTPVSLLQALGIAITLLGVVIIASAGNLTQLLTLTVNRGDAFMLLASFFYAAYSIGLSRRPHVSAMGLFSLLATAAFISSLPLLAIESYQQGFQWPTTTGWLVVIAVTVLPSFIAQIFFIKSVTLIGPGRAGVFVNLIPVFASIMAVLFLGEPFEMYHAISLALVLGGIGLSEIGKSR
ncbi:MAG: DMT family transporter [Gammaproteobacteria bacterium]|nr:DMT family transporter [Gammaproteobacteria bacterium]